MVYSLVTTSARADRPAGLDFDFEVAFGISKGGGYSSGGGDAGWVFCFWRSGLTMFLLEVGTCCACVRVWWGCDVAG